MGRNLKLRKKKKNYAVDKSVRQLRDRNNRIKCETCRRSKVKRARVERLSERNRTVD